MADAKTINGYNVKDAAAREAIANLDTVKLASEGGASGSIRFGVDGDGNYGYYKAGADTVTPFKTTPYIPTVKALNQDWTADADYEYAIVTAVRGSVPAFTYNGSGTVTEIANLDGSTSEHIRVYRVRPVKENDYFINRYKLCVMA